MAKCDLTFQVADGRQAFRPGDEVSGALEVLVDSDCRCDKLTITLGWRTHGRGNKDEGTGDFTVFGPFDWKAGELHRYDFALTMPSGPVTYHGEIINVDWSLKAEADIPWAFDPKAEWDVVLEPAPPEKSAPAAYRGAPVITPVTHDLGPAAGLQQIPIAMAVVPLLLIVAFFWFFGPDFFLADGSPNVMAIGMAGLMLFFFGRQIFKSLKNRIAKQVLGDVQVAIHPPQAIRGQTVGAQIAIHSKKSTEINGVELELIGRETAVSGSGTNKTTHRHMLHEQRVSVEGKSRVEAGQPLSLQGQVQVPEDAAPTFRGGDNKVLWTVVVHVDIPRWPDLADEHELIVQPS